MMSFYLWMCQWLTDFNWRKIHFVLQVNWLFLMREAPALGTWECGWTGVFALPKFTHPHPLP
jgi:hypothetical protein